MWAPKERWMCHLRKGQASICFDGEKCVAQSKHMEVKIHHPNGGRENWRTIKACASPSKGVFAQQPKSQHKN